MNAYSQHFVTCRCSLNMPASIEAMSHLLEEVVKLNPGLIQVRVCFTGCPLYCTIACGIEAFAQTAYSNGRDADLRKPTLEDMTDGLCCHNLSQSAQFRHAGQAPSDTK